MLKNRKLNWQVILAFLALAILIVNNLSYAAEKTKLVIWHALTGPQEEVLMEAVAKFQNKHKNIKVDLQLVSFYSLQNRFSNAKSATLGPDLLFAPNDWIEPFTQKKLLEPIDSFVAKEKNILKHYDQNALKALKVKGKLYALPESFEIVALVYNTAMIKTPPKNTDELIALAKANTGNGRYGFVYDAVNFYYSACWFHGYGVKVLDKYNQPDFNTPGAIKAANFIAELCYKYRVIPKEADSSVAMSLFNSGRAAMIISGPWTITTEQGQMAVPFKVARIPMIKETGKWADPFVGVKSIMMSKASKNKDAAFKLMKFLTSDEIALKFTLKAKNISANIDVYKDPRVKNDPIIQAFRQQVKYAVPMPSSTAMNNVWGPLNDALSSVWNARRTPKEAMNAAQLAILDELE